MNNQVKRICIGCHRWYSGDDVSHALRNRQCVCVGCQSDDEYDNETSGESTDFQRRIES